MSHRGLLVMWHEQNPGNDFGYFHDIATMSMMYQKYRENLRQEVALKSILAFYCFPQSACFRPAGDAIFEIFLGPNLRSRPLNRKYVPMNII
jgi:hypothetical protein